MIMRPFITHQQVLDIRGEELYLKSELHPLFRELRWLEGIKPLECVGTHDEAQAATWLSLGTEELVDCTLFQEFQEKILPKKSAQEWELLVDELLTLHPEHAIPSDVWGNIFGV